MKLEISVERCVIPGIPFISFFALLFVVLFFGEFYLYCNVPILQKIPDDIFPFLCLASGLFLMFFAYYLDEKRHGNTETLSAEIQDNVLILSQGPSHWRIPLTDIKETVKIMCINRVYDEKGKYKLIIRRKKHRPLTFMSTNEEYQAHVDFAETELSKLYFLLRSQGVKCC